MRIAALTAGAGVPETDFSASVAEVHASACLVDLAGGSLLALLGRELGSQPHGITLAMPAGCSFPALLARGDALAARAGLLRISEGSLIVDLRAARLWRSNLQAFTVDLRKASALAAWRVAWATLRADGRSAPFAAGAAERIAALSAASRAADAARARDAICGLIGLGPGRTPAGDDFLVGYIAGIEISPISRENLSFVATLLGHLKALGARTNRLSRLYLEAAAAGEISERLHEVAKAIAAGADPAAMQRVLAAALAVGHSSGAAGVLGLLHGCAAGSTLQSEPLDDAAPSGKAAATSPTASPRNANPMQISPSKR